MIIECVIYRLCLPKSAHSGHNTVNKNSTGQRIKTVSHPAEVTHIDVVEQVQPQGMKKQRTKKLNKSQQQSLQDNCTRQYRATVQRAIPVKKHNYPYQIGKIEVPQHQPQYDNGTHSWLSGEYQSTVKEEFLKYFNV